MIRQLYFLRTGGTDPYENLAIEACLMKHCPQDSAILYLWQNENTVVIGKNQNPWKECDLPLLQDDGIRLARRKSGGGAVYHDLGNLNFTFLLPLSDYDPLRQLDMICSALRRFGISAQKTGRNDITVDGRKVSGSAFQKSGGIGCHHGTLLVASDVEKMSRYLRPSAEKLQTKGVDSVRSRVVNLQALCPGLSVENLAAAVKEAFIQSFSLPCHELTFGDLPAEEIRKTAAEFSDPRWLYQRRMPFTWQASARFDWGEVQIFLHADCGKIDRVQIDSDAMDTVFFEKLTALWTGKPFDFSVLSAELQSIAQEPLYARMSGDIRSLLTGQNQEGGSL